MRGNWLRTVCLRPKELDFLLSMSFGFLDSCAQKSSASTQSYPRPRPKSSKVFTLCPTSAHYVPFLLYWTVFGPCWASLHLTSPQSHPVLLRSSPTPLPKPAGLKKCGILTIQKTAYVKGLLAHWTIRWRLLFSLFPQHYSQNDRYHRCK